MKHLSPNLASIRRATTRALTYLPDSLKAKERLILDADEARYEHTRLQSQYAADIGYLSSLCEHAGCTSKEIEWAGGATPTVASLADLLDAKLRIQIAITDANSEEQRSEEDRINVLLHDASQV